MSDVARHRAVINRSRMLSGDIYLWIYYKSIMHLNNNGKPLQIAAGVVLFLWRKFPNVAHASSCHLRAATYK